MNRYPDSVRGVSLLPALNEIEAAELLRPLDAGEFLFKHQLVQDTAYQSLMRHDRKRLHRLVGEALERAYPQKLDELAPRLAEHFEEAGDTARALHYFEQAADGAAARFANREALNFYTRALDAAQELQTDTRDTLYRARGVIYERIGEIEHARSDLENALQLAQAEGDVQAEWQSLQDLGFAWLAQDYARAGIYFERALELARVSNDPFRVAHSLNRVGNWYLNNEDPSRALAYHHEALSMFHKMNEKRGIAETEDLLGMTNLVGTDFIESQRHIHLALQLFQELNDARGTATAQISLYLSGPSPQSDTLVLPPFAGDIETALGEILPRLRDLGWRAGEAQALWVIGERLFAMGEYGRGLELLRESITVAREIEHRQWLAAATMLVGALYLDVLAFETAQPFLEQGLALSREVGSMHWTRVASGFLASMRIALGELDAAQEILDATLPAGTPARTLGQRQAWAARVELALARHEPDTALEWLDLLLRDASNLTPESVIPRLWCLRARALMQKKNPRAAQELLLQAHASNGLTLPERWRVAMHLAQTLRAQENAADAARYANEADAHLETLAVNLPEPQVRETFRTRARKLIWET